MPSVFDYRVPGAASMSWDEENGWSLSVRGEPLTSQVHRGLDVAPEPEDVAASAVVCWRALKSRRAVATTRFAIAAWQVLSSRLC
jgi:hypothetical protein